MTIEEAIKTLEKQKNNYFYRAAAYSQVVSYCDKQLENETVKKETYLTTAQNFIRKSKQKFLFLEIGDKRIEVSRSDDLTSQDVDNVISQLTYLKHHLEEREQATRELKERTEKMGKE